MEQEQSDTGVRDVVRQAIQEYVKAEQSKSEPAYKAELVEERKRREQLETRVNELVQENHKSRQVAEEAERGSAIRNELQRLGVAKLDLAYRAVKDDVHRAEDGRLLAKSSEGSVALKEYLAHFVAENPELLPARIAGGSGASVQGRQNAGPSTGSDLDKIKPGMNADELDRIRQDIARVASQAMRGL